MWTTWRAATERALYGPDGFYRRTAPRAHFRTSVHASAMFARAILSLAREAGQSTVVDVGAGRGELLRALHLLDPSLRLVAVEVADRPVDLPSGIEWCPALPTGLEALVVANEWLDNVPVDVVELTEDGPLLVEVDQQGDERVGGRPDETDLAWLDTWWPLAEVGQRAEVGRPRDEAWAAVVAGLQQGLAVAVDYSHTVTSRPTYGSLTGFRAGRRVPPVPDGSCDLTSHVALDACAAAGEAAGAAATVLTTQRVALHALGVRAARPDPGTAAADPSAYAAALGAAAEAAELTDPGSLGGFGWLVQSVSAPLPQSLGGLGDAHPRTGTSR